MNNSKLFLSAICVLGLTLAAPLTLEARVAVVVVEAAVAATRRNARGGYATGGYGGGMHAVAMLGRNGAVRSSMERC